MHAANEKVCRVKIGEFSNLAEDWAIKSINRKYIGNYNLM